MKYTCPQFSQANSKENHFSHQDNWSANMDFFFLFLLHLFCLFFFFSLSFRSILTFFFLIQLDLFYLFLLVFFFSFSRFLDFNVNVTFSANKKKIVWEQKKQFANKWFFLMGLTGPGHRRWFVHHGIVSTKCLLM